MSTSGSPTATRRTLTTSRVVFLVIAAAAPMVAMVGNLPLSLARGNGAGTPAAYLVAAVVLVCFAAGYGAMSRRVVNTGAFSTYVARSLGRPAGVAASYVGVVAYAALAAGLSAAFGYFTGLVLGGGVPWWVLSAGMLALVAVLGHRSAEVSARVLGALMLAEFLVLLVFDVATGVQRGTDALPAISFAPSVALSGVVGISLMLAFTSFVGFESAALYGEETRDPERSIPRATFVALGVIAVFYLLTSWFVVGAAGGADAPALARQQLGDLVFGLFDAAGGPVLSSAAAVLLCTSVLASGLALHNAASRYLFAAGRERVAPARVGALHPRHHSPHVASAAVAGASALALAAFAVTGADPYTGAAAVLVGVGTVGVVALQAAASLAVVVFFRGRADRTWWAGTVAPMIGFAGLTVALALVVTQFGTLTGSDSPWIGASPVLLVLAAVAGALVALRLRRTRPAAYQAIATSRLRGRTAVETEPVSYRRRYCIVGGGPSGLIMARALRLEGVPFDWFERHTALGGIWDADNPGSPMYDSAHFISSRYTSGFYGAPMPTDYPDYPTWRQIRDYIRATAEEFGLADAVTLGVEVRQAEPLPGDRWRVSLSTGEVRDYDGLIACPGVTWHPAVPELPGQDGFTGEVRHSVTFRSALEFRGRRVLVVGAGNSGVDIACDAARNADTAFLSVRRGYRFVPKHVFGLPTDAVLLGALAPPKGAPLPAHPNDLVDMLVGDLTRLGLPAPDHDVLTSHPIMNTQVLHHLAHGDLVAKPDVARLTADGVEFVDGTLERVDLVLLATGYTYRLPFLDPDLLTWNQGHPDLYLNVFSREHDSLYALGLIEFADAAYQRFDEMAQLIVTDIRARETGRGRDEMRRLKAEDAPDLRGGIAYLDSPRHVSYVDSATYQAYLAELRDRFGRPDPGEHTYDRLRVRSTGEVGRVTVPA